jgi:hypothetical protein
MRSSQDVRLETSPPLLSSTRHVIGATAAAAAAAAAAGLDVFLLCLIFESVSEAGSRTVTAQRPSGQLLRRVCVCVCVCVCVREREREREREIDVCEWPSCLYTLLSLFFLCFCLLDLL